MSVNYKWLAKVLVVPSLCLTLTGCFTMMLGINSEPTSKLKQWKSDIITAVSLAQDNEGNKGYVFVGKTFDYLLTDGGDNVVKLLKDPRIDRHNLSVVDMTKFIIEGGKKQFNGDLTLKFQWKTEEAKQIAISYGFYCYGERCLHTLSGLKGTIHKKNKKQDYSQVLEFYHPFNVEFYAYKTSGIPRGVAKVLAPVAVTLDIVTSPLQLLGFSIVHSIIKY